MMIFGLNSGSEISKGALGASEESSFRRRWVVVSLTADGVTGVRTYYGFCYQRLRSNKQENTKEDEPNEHSIHCLFVFIYS
jgi:hypothetical protein